MEMGTFVKIKSGPYKNYVGVVLKDIGPAVHVLVMDTLKITYAHHQLEAVDGGRRCETCVHCEFWYDSGDRENPPDEGMECGKVDELEVGLFAFFEVAHWDSPTVGHNCPFYEVRKAFCGHCGKDLGPEYKCGLWANTFYGDPVPVCSMECKAEIERENDYASK